MRVLLVVLFVLSLLTFEAIAQNVQCLDINGKAVDWWFMYKLGESVSNPNKGYTSVYTDSNNPKKWTQGNFNSSNAAYYTTAQIGLYGGNAGSDVGWVMWNDQTHKNLDGSCVDHYYDSYGYIYGHTKGMVGYDTQTGFWITHSAPGFPYDHTLSPQSWYFPHAQSIYGQNFFCVSVKTSDLNNIGTYLQYYHAYVYDVNLATSPGSGLTAFAHKGFTQGSGNITFTSLGGQSFQAIGKNGEVNADIYEDYIAPGLNQGLNVECWCGGDFGDDCQPSYCAGSPIVNPSGPQGGQSNYAYDVVTIEALNFGAGNAFTTEYNHAKYAVSQDQSNPWYCAADNNRETSQRKRGGGAVCFENVGLWTLMNAGIAQLNTTCSN